MNHVSPVLAVLSILLLAGGALTAFLGGRLAKGNDNRAMLIRLAGLLVTMLGTLLSIYTF